MAIRTYDTQPPATREIRNLRGLALNYFAGMIAGHFEAHSTLDRETVEMYVAEAIAVTK